MSAGRQIWLVTMREIRERSRTGAFRASFAVMILVTVGLIIMPTLLSGEGADRVGLAGVIPTGLPDSIQVQSDAVGTTVQVHRYDSVAVGEQAVRDGDIDVLVVDAQRLEWRRQSDERLRGVLVGAIQLVAVGERANAAGIDLDELAILVAPVSIEEVELGSVAGRSPDDETAAIAMTIALFIAISTYGNLVLSGVVEEKSSRVVEVLLARMPARNLLAGKIAGIGLLGLAQVAVTALVALVALSMADSIDLPAARGAVLAWALVWFLLGYALYATVYGALGSLASRSEDAQAAAGPVMAVLMVGFFASFVAVGRPHSGLAQLASFFPATAPLTMPNRIAMGATTWWEPLIAVAATLAAIVGLVLFGGRVYAGAVLHTGPTLKLRDAWRRGTAEGSHVETTVRSPHGEDPSTDRANHADRNSIRGLGP